MSLRGKYASLIQYIASLRLVNSFWFYNSEMIVCYTSSFCSPKNFAETELSEYDLSLYSLMMYYSISNCTLPSIFISFVSLVPIAFDVKVESLTFVNMLRTLPSLANSGIFKASALPMI
jgi:hypothetical protein